MRNLRIRYSRFAILLCCISFAGCMLPNIKDQKPGQVCITLANRTLRCLPVDDERLLVLRNGPDDLALTTWDAKRSLYTGSLGNVPPSKSLVDLLKAQGGAGQSYILDPAKTTVKFQDGAVRFSDRKSGKQVEEIVLDAKQFLLISPASSAGSYEVVLFTEEVCPPVSELESLLLEDDGRYDVQLQHCGDSIYARMGHVIVAISEIKAILVEPTSLPDTCRSKHEREGLVVTYDVASTMEELNSVAEGDEVVMPSAPVRTMAYLGLRIYQCGNLFKFVPEDARESPFYLDPKSCCYVLRYNKTDGLLEIYLSDLSV